MAHTQRFTLAALAVCLLLITPCAHAEGPTTAPTTQPAAPPFTISRETTYYTAPLNPDGTVDYVAALNAKFGQGVTPDNNAAVLILQAIGYRAIGADKHEGAPQQFADALQTELPADEDIFQELDRFYWEDELEADDMTAFSDLLEAEYQRSLEGPWRSDDLPRIAQWLDANSVPLSVLLRASQRSKYFVPLIPLPFEETPVAGLDEMFGRPLDPLLGSPPTFLCANDPLTGYLFRDGLRALTIRANHATGESRSADAWADIVAVYRLGGLVGQRPFLSDWLDGKVDMAIAMGAARRFCTSTHLTAQEAQRFLNEWQQLTPLASPAEALSEGDRVFALDMICWGASRPEALRRQLAQLCCCGLWLNRLMESEEEEEEEIYWFDVENAERVTELLANVNWDEVLRVTNDNLDREASAMELPLPARADVMAERAKAAQEHWAPANDLPEISSMDAAEARRAATEWTIHVMSGGMPGLPLDTHLLQADKIEVEHELVAIALALAIYRAEHGAYPPSLDKLTPGQLEKIGPDVFSGRPYAYRAGENGYLLYSVGMDMKDDGGEGDDIVIDTRK